MSAALDRLAGAFAALPGVAEMPDHRAFERLSAAVVFRWLGEPTVHDLTLRGVSEAPHQVDVVVGDDRQRALIECKYYARRIDIPVVRNFWAAAEDIGFDMAAIITTEGYSANARTYARAKGVDLLILRETVDEDLQGRVTGFDLSVTAFMVQLQSVRMECPRRVGDTGPDELQMEVAIDDRSVVLEFGSGRELPFVDRYHEHYASLGFEDPDGLYPRSDVFDEATWLRVGGQRIEIIRIDWEFSVSRSETTSKVRHTPLVSLVSDTGDVLAVVSEEQLAALGFDGARRLT